MAEHWDPNEVCKRIQALKDIAKELEQMGESIPAVARNTARILASIKMLEINMCDWVEGD